MWEWHLWDHLVQDFDKSKANYGNVAEHPELVNINYGEDELPSVIAAREGKGKPAANDKPAADQRPRIDPDYTHVNGVAYNPDLDQIAVSIWPSASSGSSITARRPPRRRATPAAAGAGRRPPVPLGQSRGPIGPARRRTGSSSPSTTLTGFPKGLPGAGHLLLFNNGRERPEGNYSSVDELALPVDSQGDTRQPGTAYGPDQPVWSYAAPKKTDFYSSFISGAERVSNGNTLICSGANGTIFEVTPEKAIVWKYVNPFKNEVPIGEPPRPGRIMTSLAGEMLAISADQRKQLDEIQKDIDAHLDRFLTADQKKQFAVWPRNPDGEAIDAGDAPARSWPATSDRLKLRTTRRTTSLPSRRRWTAGSTGC